MEAGSTTTADFVVRVGDVAESVRVEAATPQIRFDAASVSGSISRDQIEGLPLNGRNFLELGKLEPGVQQPAAANRNRTILPVLGATAANVGGARFTVDGGSVTAMALGGSQMGFSQEGLQEFQVSTVNFDLAAGMTDAGSINVVTRGGGNQPKGTIFYFFRDHNLAAYPVLIRDPNNPDPFFQRQQFGFAAGGPVRRDRVFYFGSWERNDQDAVAGTTLLVPDFAHLSRVTSSPLVGDLFTARLDAKVSDAPDVLCALLARWQPRVWTCRCRHRRRFAKRVPVELEPHRHQRGSGSGGVDQRASADARQRPAAFRLRRQLAAVAAPVKRTVRGASGLGQPSITIAQTGLVIGNAIATDNLARRFHLTDSIIWQATTHRVRVGLDWEHNRDRNLIWSNEPVTMTLFAPGRVRTHNSQPGVPQQERIPLPTAFRTIDDILQLPLQSMTVGIGDPGVPQEDGGVVRRWNTVWLYAEDAWRRARSGHADVRIGLGLRRRAQSRPQQAALAGATPRERWSGTDAPRMEQLRTGRRRDLDAVIGPENRPPRRRGPVLPAPRIDVGHGRRTGCARPARPWPADRAGERHSQPIARNPGCPGRHAAGLSQLTHTVHRRRCHGDPSGDQGHSRPEPGRRRSDRAAD